MPFLVDSAPEVAHPQYVEALLDAVPTGVIVTHPDGTISYLNAEIERLFGYSAAELMGQCIDMLLPDRFRHHHHHLRQGYVENPSTRYMGAGRDLFGRRKDGSEVPLEIGLRTLGTDDAPLIIATIVDITARKQSDERFAKVIEASPYGQLLVDEAGVIQLLNPALLNMFGYSAEELLGQSMEKLLPERYRRHHVELRQGYQQNPSVRAMGSGRDLTALHKNGAEIPVEIGLSPVMTSSGRLTLAVIVDITERKRLELNLRQANAHLEEFTYVASHDLKSPLRGISDLVEWIEEDLQDENLDSVQKNIGRIKVRISKMERLVEDLLLYARSGKKTKESVQVDIAELISGIIELHPVPENFRVDVDIQLASLQTAKTPLETVLRNLFSNAIKHHDGIASPVIQIRAVADGNYCRFTVEDNGPGVPKAAHDRIFRLFQTLNGSDRAASGIGLALAKRLTESHGGIIELVPPMGQCGACFQVLWPRFSRRDLDE